MQLLDKENKVQVKFKVEEIEYDRAEGAGISIEIKDFNLKGIFHNIWFERIRLAHMILALDDFRNQKTDLYHVTYDAVDFSFMRNPNHELFAGIKVRRDFSGRIPDFPIEFSLSFEITQLVLNDFIKDLKALEKNCRPY